MGTLFLYLFIVVSVAYIGLGVMLLVMQPRLMYRPMRDVVYSPSKLGLEFEDVFFTTSDGVALHGWFLPCAGARYTVLFCHGNAGNISHRLDSVNILHGLGVHCFIFDYRGYGRSQGTPTEAGTYLDAEAAYAWLTQDRGIRPEQVVIFGRSMGGAVASHLASRVASAGLVIESAFTSYGDVGQRFYPYMPVRPFARFKYRTCDYIRDVHRPVLLIHSRQDRLAPFAFGVRLYALANEPKTFVEVMGGHNDFFLVSGEAYRQAWRRWLDGLDEPSEEGHPESNSK